MDDKKMSRGQEVGMSSIAEANVHAVRFQSAEGYFGSKTDKDALEPHIVHIDPLEKEEFEKHKSVTTFVPNIYKVPERIRQANKNAFEPYEPRIVSIGPYHHPKKKELEKHKERYQKSILEFEKHKEQYKKSILLRNHNHPLKDYCAAIAKLENEARRYYSEEVGLNFDEFVEMMVLDGCFIVELFLSWKKKKEEEKKSKDVPKPEKEQSEDDPIFSTIWMLPLIRYDMLLLENQIPFFVLQEIYERASPGNGSLVKLALDFFEPIIPNNNKNQSKDSDHQIDGPFFHLLHLFHSYLMPTHKKKSELLPCSNGSNKAELPTRNNPSPPIKMIPCAAELQLAGVKFKKKEDFSSFLDVKFSGGVMEIPHLCIDDYTNTLLRNLVALEQICYPGVETIHFTNYAGFMDCLVNTSKDVALLHRNRIIDHLLGSDGHVASLFNQLCYGIFNDFEDHNYLSGIYKDVDKYYNTPWNMRWASLKTDYFTNPWSSLSSGAAIILILLTMAQTFYTIFPYYRPRS